jgi:hypothetical protein
MQVYFVPQLLPRTWTRAQWYKAWQWVRVARGAMKQHEENRTKWLRDPDLDPKLRQDLIEEMVNPPLLIGPGMEAA